MSIRSRASGNIASWAGRRVLIMGLGLHGGGLSAALWFLRHGAVVLVTDLRDRRALASSVGKLQRQARAWGVGKRLMLRMGEHRDEDFRNADLVVQNPGVPRQSPFLSIARHAGIPIVNEASFFLQHCQRPVIGVTGTRGKTTTALLVQHLLKGKWPKTLAVGNLRDTTFFQVLDRTRRKGRAPVVAELSSWQLELLPTIQRSPEIAVLTNLYPDHLNRYHGMADYAAAKANIFRYQKASCILIANADNAWTRRLAKKAPGQVYWFSVNGPVRRGVWFDGERFLWREKIGAAPRRVAKVTDCPLPGAHNLANAAAAIAAALAFGLPVRLIPKRLRTFRGVPYRLQRVRQVRGITFYNDSASTSPEALMAALQAMGGRKAVFIIGGTDKGLDYHQVARTLVRASTPFVLLPGTATDKLLAALPRPLRQRPVRSMREAVRQAFKFAQRVGAEQVVLSPGSASFGLFQHEFDRGDQLNAAVRSLRKS